MKRLPYKQALFASFCFILTACSLSTKQFFLPQQIDFKGESYVMASHSQVDEMQQSLYLPKQSAQDPEKWQKGFLLFTDKNSSQKSLEERLALRQAAFQSQPKTQAKLSIVENELRSTVIYPPIERHPDYQLEVSRGRDSACGFSQLQYADKRSVTSQNLQISANDQLELVKLSQAITQLPWLIGCQ